MHVLVVTTVHTPDDARILHRQARALMDDGHKVTLAAPWQARGVQPVDGLEMIDLPRAAGRRRTRAFAAALRLLQQPPKSVNLVLVHDPELLFAVAVARPEIPVVWDVHEDLAASLTDKTWLPTRARAPFRQLVRTLERKSESRVHLILAEEAYASRFVHPHPVVLNLPWLRSLNDLAVEPRVVYVGRVSAARGAHDLIRLSELLACRGITVDVVGPADAGVRAKLTLAAHGGVLKWHGALPNPEALALLDGALAGLSLLHDQPNYRHSMPTKVLEYMERGLPVITTPLPLARAVVETHGCGIVVPFEDPAAVATAVLSLRSDQRLRDEMSRQGRQAVCSFYNWNDASARFVSQLEEWAVQTR